MGYGGAALRLTMARPVTLSPAPGSFSTLRRVYGESTDFLRCTYQAGRAKTPRTNKTILLRRLFRGFPAIRASKVIARGSLSDDFERNLKSVRSFRTVCKIFATRENASKSAGFERRRNGAILQNGALRL
jgi:hypothetical protein